MRTIVQRTAIALFCIGMLYGCSKCGRSAEEQVSMQLSAEKGVIQSEKDRTDSLYRETLRQLDEMVTVLQALEAEEGIVRTMGPEKGETPATFKQRMEDIARRMNEKTATIRKQAGEITNLKQKLAATEAKLAAVSKRADSLASLVSVQQKEIVALREQLTSSRKTIDSLRQKMVEKDAIIASKIKDLNRAHYIVNTKDDLLKKGIIDKQGQVLFFGGRIAVKQNFDTKDFTTIDITEIKEIPVKAAKDDVSIVSTHDTDTYEVVESGEGACIIKIKEPQRFWKGAKYLVIMVD